MEYLHTQGKRTMITSPSGDIDQALEKAQHWTQFEGVTEVISRSGLGGQALVVITSCNPAAITAPIPSIFHGYPVCFWEAPTAAG